MTSTRGRSHFFILLFIIIFGPAASGQGNIFFCDSVGADCKAINEFEVLIVDPEGQHISVMYAPGNHPMPDITRMEVSILSNKTFKRMSETQITCETGTNFIKTKYLIEKPGDYRFRFLCRNGSTAAEEVLSVSESMQEKIHSDEGTSKEFTERDLEVNFTDALSDSVGGENTEFNFRQSGGKIFMCLSPHPGAGERFEVQLKRKNGETYTHTGNNQSIQWPVSKPDSGNCASLIFPSPGDFMVVIMDAQRKYLTSGYISWR